MRSSAQHITSFAKRILWCQVVMLIGQCLAEVSRHDGRASGHEWLKGSVATITLGHQAREVIRMQLNLEAAWSETVWRLTRWVAVYMCVSECRTNSLGGQRHVCELVFEMVVYFLRRCASEPMYTPWKNCIKHGSLKNASAVHSGDVLRNKF